MKKTLSLLILSGIVTFCACGPSSKEKAKIEKEILDSIKRDDSLKNILALDSIKKVRIADSLTNLSQLSEKEKTTNCKCETTNQFSGVITKFNQPGTSGLSMTIKTDDNKEIFCYCSVFKIDNENIVTKEESGYLKGDAVFNTTLLNNGSVSFYKMLIIKRFLTIARNDKSINNQHFVILKNEKSKKTYRSII